MIRRRVYYLASSPSHTTQIPTHTVQHTESSMRASHPNTMNHSFRESYRFYCTALFSNSIFGAKSHWWRSEIAKKKNISYFREIIFIYFWSTENSYSEAIALGKLQSLSVNPSWLSLLESCIKVLGHLTVTCHLWNYIVVMYEVAALSIFDVVKFTIQQRIK